jgi:hypothetical protein
MTQEPEPPAPRVRRTVGRPRKTDGDDSAMAATIAAPAQRGEAVASVQLAHAGAAGGPASIPDPQPAPAGAARAMTGHASPPDHEDGDHPAAGNGNSGTGAAGRRRRVTADQQAAPRTSAEIGDEEAAG